MNATLINRNVTLPYFQARADAKRNGGRLVSHFNLDFYKMAGNRGAFWARELVVSGVPLKNGKDVKDKETSIILPASALKRAHESSKNGVYGRNGLVLFTDAENFSESKGFKVIEEPTIIVVENAVLEMGGKGKADEITKIALKISDEEFEKLKDDQKRWNYFNNGVRPLVRDFVGDFRRLVYAGYLPSLSFGVLVEGATAQAPQAEANGAKIIVPASATDMKTLETEARQALGELATAAGSAFAAQVAKVQNFIDAVRNQ